jgi:TPP-dependent pyruvate/acetoin dehydrogenase alpha subunit
MKYVPKPLVDAWTEYDPLARIEQHVLRNGLLDPGAIEEKKSAIQAAIDLAIDTADQEPAPSGPEANEGVFRVWSPEWTVPDGAERL